MATTPGEDEPISTPRRERVARAVTTPVSSSNLPVTLLAISAGLGALAPFPAGALVAALLVVAAAKQGRR